MVFLVDLPRLPADGPRPSKQDLTTFGQELIYFLEAMGLEDKVIQGVLLFDFSRLKDIAFVHTMYVS